MLSAAATVLLVPPVNLALLALAGVALAGRRPRLGRRLAGGALALLLLLALPVVSESLLATLTPPPAPPDRTLDAPPQAIVILGGDVTETEAGTAPGPLSLERLRAGASLRRSSGLPILITGGVLGPSDAPLATLMARSLVGDFALPVRWVEPRAHDTWENARFSAELLRRDGVTTVYLVTHAWHMRRALLAFAAAGIVAVPAAVPAERPPRFMASEFVPRVSSWQRGYFALHEWIGTAWYWWQAAR